MRVRLGTSNKNVASRDPRQRRRGDDQQRRQREARGDLAQRRMGMADRAGAAPDLHRQHGLEERRAERIGQPGRHLALAREDLAQDRRGQRADKSRDAQEKGDGAEGGAGSGRMGIQGIERVEGIKGLNRVLPVALGCTGN